MVDSTSNEISLIVINPYISDTILVRSIDGILSVPFLASSRYDTLVAEIKYKSYTTGPLKGTNLMDEFMRYSLICITKYGFAKYTIDVKVSRDPLVIYRSPGFSRKNRTSYISGLIKHSIPASGFSPGLGIEVGRKFRARQHITGEISFTPFNSGKTDINRELMFALGYRWDFIQNRSRILKRADFTPYLQMGAALNYMEDRLTPYIFGGTGIAYRFGKKSDIGVSVIYNSALGTPTEAKMNGFTMINVRYTGYLIPKMGCPRFR